MKLLSKRVSLRDDLSIEVFEADASYNARVTLLAEQADKAVSEDKTFLYFYRNFYPLMASLVGDHVLPAEDAYQLPPDKLDEWYLAAWELNPDLLGPYVAEPKREEVTFRDDTTLVLYQSRDLPSFILKLVRLEYEAQGKENVPAHEVTFREYVYPKIAASANGGNVPSPDEACKFPLSELTKWTLAAQRLNPKWFSLIEEVTAQTQAEAAETLKKKERRRRSSSRS